MSVWRNAWQVRDQSTSRPGFEFSVCLLGLLLAGSLVGCSSRFVAATITNETDQAIKVVELDYPGAGFGVSTLAPHGVYSYRFKAIGSGPLSLSYTEASGAPHTAAGPVLQDGQGGSLVVHIGEHGAVTWEPVFNAR